MGQDPRAEWTGMNDPLTVDGQSITKTFKIIYGEISAAYDNTDHVALLNFILFLKYVKLIWLNTFNIMKKNENLALQKVFFL